MNNLLEWALWYQEKGFDIIPTDPRLPRTDPRYKKKPLFSHKGKTPLTRDEIKEIWTKTPNAGIALKMDNIFSIDVDTKEHNGKTKIDGLATFKKEFRDQLPAKDFETLTAVTPSGGLHLYYLKPKGKINKTKSAIFPGIDIQAEAGNISVLPPTTINGKPYKWLNKKPIITPSKELTELLEKRLYTSKSFIKTDYSKVTNHVGIYELIAFGLGDVGSRNDTLTRLFGSLLGRRVNVNTAIKLARIANDMTADPLPDNEVNRTINSILERELEKRGKQQ